jgi:hypothetical protein
MTNKEQMNTLFELYKEGLISKSDLAIGIKSINEPEQKDSLEIEEDILNNDLYKTDEARKLAQESRNESKALKERQAQRDADRFESESKAKREEELKAIHKELSDDRKIIIDILSSFKNRVTDEGIYSISSLQHMPTKDLLKLYNDMEVNAPNALKQIIDSKGYTEWAERRTAKDALDDSIVVEQPTVGESKESTTDFELFGDDDKEVSYDHVIESDVAKTGVDFDNKNNNSVVDDTLVLNKDVFEKDDGTLTNVEVPQVETSVSNENDLDDVEKPEDLLPQNNVKALEENTTQIEQPEADLTPERHRLVSMIAGAKTKFQELINNKANVAVAACIAIGGAAAVIATGPVGFTALGAIAQATGSAALIGGGGVVSAAAANNYTKGR